MNSSNSGLVRRTNAAKSSETNGSASAQNDLNDNFKNGSEDENLEETSDKETRLTLMEEVLLLGLKDKEVMQNRIFFGLFLQQPINLTLASSLH
jgi:hypothetical protein